MAKKNLTLQNRNNETRQVQATVSKVANTNMGEKLVSGDEYTIGSCAAGAVLVSATLNITTAFDGTDPKADIKLGSTLLWDDQDLSVVGATTLKVDTKNLASFIPAEGADLVLIPDLTNATAGKLEVILTYVDSNIVTGTYNSRD